MSTQSVWVSWREKRQRWEVGFKWEGKVYQYFSWKFQGRRFSFTIENKNIANEYAAHIRSLMRPNVQGICTFDPGQLTGTGRGQFSFKNYVKMFLDECEVKMESDLLTKETLSQYVRYNRMYWEPFFGTMDIREINTVAVKQFYLSLSKKKLSKEYKQHIMKPLHRLVKQACAESRIEPPLFPDYKMTSHDMKPISWVKEDVQDRVIERIPEKHRAIVRLLAYHGLRQVEARNLTWDDFNKEEGILTVRTAKKGRPRYLLLDEKVIDDMKRIPRCIGHNYIFNCAGRQYDPRWLYKLMRKALNDEGLTGVTPHAFSRHSHATHILQRGGSTRLAQDILGHSKITTTERYTHIVMEDQAKVQRSTFSQPDIQVVNHTK